MLLMFAAIPLCSASAQPNPPSVMSASDAAARSFWSALDATWNARDANRISQLFAEDASFRFTDSGLSLEGRATIYEFFAKQFSRQAPELRHVTHIRDIRMVAAHVVAVDAHIEVVKAPQNGTPRVVRSFAAFALMQESSDAWKLRLLRVHQLPPAVRGAVHQNVLKSPEKQK
jgi:uncharacterized protein (TIGR02246 family)